MADPGDLRPPAPLERGTLARAADDEAELFWRTLLDFIEDEDEGVVPIIGQDLLILQIGDREVPLYTYLAEQLAEKLSVSATALPAVGALNQVICSYLKAHSRDLHRVYWWINALIENLDARIAQGEIPIPEPLRKLAEIHPLRLFVTTTFDSTLKHALKTARQEDPEVLVYSTRSKDDLDTGFGEDRTTVYHLLGSSTHVAHDFAVTEEDVLELMHLLQADKKRPERLFDELNRKHLLIIGNSFSEWLARFFIRVAMRERFWTATKRTDFVADVRMLSDTGLIAFLEHFSVNTRIFKISDAREFVNELHRRWMERQARKPPRAPASSEDQGSIFLSYAHEDHRIVDRLRRALEGLRLRVWHDEHELRGGDEIDPVIELAIKKCGLFLPILTQETETKDARYFRLEWSHALLVRRMLKAQKRFIVPVLVGEASLEASGTPADFRGYRALRLKEGEEERLAREIRDLFRNEQDPADDDSEDPGS